MKEELKHYVNLLHRVYDTGTNNHPEHNSNPDYWGILLGDIIAQKPIGWNGLDFGCGKGRNVTNLLSLTEWNRVDGVDISIDNINHNKMHYQGQKSKWYLNNGTDLSELKTDEYDFVMSTIVFQHLPVHSLRIGIFDEIARVLKPGGIFSFQMGYGDMEWGNGHGRVNDYYADNYGVGGSNGTDDVRVSDSKQLTDDLEKLGYEIQSVQIKNSWADGGHPEWIYVNAKLKNK